MNTQNDTPPASFSRMMSHKLLSQAEEARLARKARKGDQEAINELVSSNIRFVLSMVKDHYLPAGVSYEDLVSAGILGLVAAAEKFDPSKGRFTTYARWHVKHKITDHLDKFAQGVAEIPRGMVASLSKVRSSIPKLTENLGREPTAEEIAEDVNVPLKHVVFLMQIVAPVSIDSPIADQTGSTLAEIIQGDDARDELRQLENAELVECLMDVLTEQERVILRGRFGIGGEPLTLDELGKRFKLTRERIRQIEFNALKKMRSSHAEIRSKREEIRLAA